MCSIDVCDVQLDELPPDPWTDEEWEVALAESHESARRSHWGRFMRLYGADDGDPLSVDSLSDDELIRRLADTEALATQLMLLQARDLRALRQRRLDEQATVRPAGHNPEACTQGCCDADGWVTLEAAQSLALSEHQVQRRLETGERLERYHHVAAAVRDGLLQSWTATKLLEHLDALAVDVSASALGAVEQATVTWLTDRPRTVGQLNARMRRLLVRAREDGGANDQEITAANRRVHVVPADVSGLATLIARLPEADALAIAGTLRALAAEPVDPADDRTRDQRVCDVLTGSVTGLRAEHGCSADVDLLLRGTGSFSVRLDVTIPASSLVGQDAPAQIPGYGVVPASTARSIAALGRDDARVRPLVYDPSTGRLVGAAHRHELTDDEPRIAWLDAVLPSRSYHHPPQMEQLVHLRDATCRAPGCPRRAQRCDCDHVVPYPEGATSVDNTCCLCRRHHRLKTHAPGWSLHHDPAGTATWTTPTGRSLTTDPADCSEPDPLSADTDDPKQDVPPF
jgi:hypothetical protein